MAISQTSQRTLRSVYRSSYDLRDRSSGAGAEPASARRCRAGRNLVPRRHVRSGRGRRAPPPAVELQRGGRRRRRATAAPAAAAFESGTGPVQGYLAGQSTTGMKTDTPLRETAQSITVVDRRSHGRSGRDECSGCPALCPGVLRRRLRLWTRAATIRASAVRTPISILDGTRAADAYQFNEWRPDPYTAERIEVMRGPASVLYGDTSTAGLINLISKRPQAEGWQARSAFNLAASTASRCRSIRPAS